MKEFDKEYEEALFATTIDKTGYGKILTANILKPIKIENNCYVIIMIIQHFMLILTRELYQKFSMEMVMYLVHIN